MLVFVAPTFDKSFTWLALAFSASCLILTPQTIALPCSLSSPVQGWDIPRTVGTTRECWTYYTLQKPPLFAILAHGMAAVAFWRAGSMLRIVIEQRIESGERSRRDGTIVDPMDRDV
jgi:hypothetical protein